MTDAQTIRDMADEIESMGINTDQLRQIADNIEVLSRTDNAIMAIMYELALAEKKWPDWTTDPVHAAGFLTEEAGECQKAANEYYYEGKSLMEIAREAAQTGAVAIRVLLGIGDYIRKPDTEPDICGACAHWLSEGYVNCGVCGREL